MTLRRTVWGLVVAAALVALGLWVYSQGEWVEVELTVGYRGEAARNPYLAAGRFLRRMGIPARELGRRGLLEGPPADGDVLVAAGGRHGVAEPLVEDLLAWAAAGHHLVVRAAPGGDAGAADPLLDALGVATQHYERVADPGASSLWLDGRDLEARFTAPVRLAATAGLAVLGSDDYGPLALQGPWGRGRVTVLAGFGPFTNRHLGAHDHAELLLRLVAPAGGVPVVGFSLEEEMPGLLTWLWRRIPEALLSLGLLGLLFMWRRGHRFGRIAPLPPSGRRSLLEHMDAAGWFLWRRGLGGRLLEAVRDALLRRAAERVPGLGRRPYAEQVRLIARMSGLSQREVETALALPAGPTAQELVRRAATLENIRKKL